MAEDATDLAQYLTRARSNGASPCWCETCPPDVLEQVNAAAAAGSRQWAAMLRWMETQGVIVTEGRFDSHFKRRHHLV